VGTGERKPRARRRAAGRRRKVGRRERARPGQANVPPLNRFVMWFLLVNRVVIAKTSTENAWVICVLWICDSQIENIYV
jgi:hypothetical protein